MLWRVVTSNWVLSVLEVVLKFVPPGTGTGTPALAEGVR
jgi:hypothetical protein